MLSMAAFALAASISPGPVNIVALSLGARYGFGASLHHVTGATVGFVALLLLTGFGLHEVLLQWPALADAIRWFGVAFLLYMAFRLAADSGQLASEADATRPSMSSGAAMQWLNPKAWLASVAGMGAYAVHGESRQVWLFAGIYFVVCYGSIAAWAYLGSRLQALLQQPARVRLFNRVLALLLVASAAYMVLG